MKRCLIILLLLFPYIFYAQISADDTKRKLNGIEKMLLIKPDSARVLIRQITDLKGKYPDSIYAMANVFYGFYHILKNNPDSSVIYYGKALDYSVNNPAMHAKALRFMAAAYRKKANYEKSLQLLDRAEAEFKGINNTLGLATVYGEMGANYNAMLRPQDAIPYLVKSIDFFKKAHNKKDFLPVQQSLANTYMNIGNYEFAVELYKEVLAGFKNVGMLKNYYLTLINYSECLTSLEKYDMAKTSLIEAIGGLEQFKDYELIGNAYSALGRLEERKGDYVQAGVWYEKGFKMLASVNSTRTLAAADSYILNLQYMRKREKALDVVSFVESGNFKVKANLNDLANYEKSKTLLYRRMQKHDLAIESAKTTIGLLDTLSNTEDKKAVIEMQAEIQQEYQNEKNKELKHVNSVLSETVEKTEDRKLLWIYLPLAILAGLAVYYFYRNTQHRKKLDEGKTTIDALAVEHLSAQSLNETLKATTEEKQGQLEDMELAAECIQDNINRLISLYSTPLAHRNERDLKFMKSGLKHLVGDDNYRERFSETFSASNAAFEEKLSREYPQLTKKDLFFCSLVSLSLPYKDLAIILQVVPEAVRKRKYRLRKKMNISEDEELEKVLAGLGGK